MGSGFYDKNGIEKYIFSPNSGTKLLTYQYDGNSNPQDDNSHQNEITWNQTRPFILEDLSGYKFTEMTAGQHELEIEISDSFKCSVKYDLIISGNHAARHKTNANYGNLVYY